MDLLTDNPLRYALGVETVDSASLLGKNFPDPFAYTMSVVRAGERHETPVALPETFHYLLGLRTETQVWIDDVLAITGTNAQGQYCLTLWRNLNAIDKLIRGWGMSFFDDYGYYPDFILWLKNDDHQHVVFLDPK